MRKTIILLTFTILFSGCASTKSANDGSADVEKKKSCTSIKVMGSKLPKRVCKS